MIAEQMLSLCNFIMDCDITKRERTNDISYKRYIYFALCRYADEDISLSEIGRACGGRSHSTVINGLKVFYDVVVNNEYYWNIYQKCLEHYNSIGTETEGDVKEKIYKDHIK